LCERSSRLWREAGAEQTAALGVQSLGQHVDRSVLHEQEQGRPTGLELLAHLRDEIVVDADIQLAPQKPTQSGVDQATQQGSTEKEPNEYPPQTASCQRGRLQGPLEGLADADVAVLSFDRDGGVLDPYLRLLDIHALEFRDMRQIFTGAICMLVREYDRRASHIVYLPRR